MIVLFCNYKK